MDIIYLLLIASAARTAQSWSSVRTPHEECRHKLTTIARAGVLASALSFPFPQVSAAANLKEILERSDVDFPPELKGDWRTLRKITLVEGDAGMAEAVWRGFGGTGDFKALTETYTTRFMLVKDRVVVDRGLEIQSRIGEGGEIVGDWTPDRLKYTRGGKNEVEREVDIRVWQRSVEHLEGVGYKELSSITNNGFERIAEVKRRYRPGSGGAWDGLEIIKTFRLLDGVVGDLPTSTIKSRIRLERAL